MPRAEYPPLLPARHDRVCRRWRIKLARAPKDFQRASETIWQTAAHHLRDASLPVSGRIAITSLGGSDVSVEISTPVKQKGNEAAVITWNALRKIDELYGVIELQGRGRQDWPILDW